MYFYSRPRAGAIAGNDADRKNIIEFLLTPPGGGDPSGVSPAYVVVSVFLLTPPGGGDRASMPSRALPTLFLLTPPGGGDPEESMAKVVAVPNFYSRPRAGAIFERGAQV